MKCKAYRDLKAELAKAAEEAEYLKSKIEALRSQLDVLSSEYEGYKGGVVHVIELPHSIETLGEAIRYLRAKRGMTLRALARKLDVSAPFLSDVEHNRRRTDKLKEFAEALGVEFAQLEERDGRLPADLKDWISSTPGLVTLLKAMRASGKTTAQLRTVLSRRK